ncbi:MAG: hypothetical protein V9F00_00290 [Nocardioides sp.]
MSSGRTSDAWSTNRSTASLSARAIGRFAKGSVAHRRNPVHGFAGDTQGLPAGDDHPEAGDASQHGVDDASDRFHDVLGVVDEEDERRRGKRHVVDRVDRGEVANRVDNLVDGVALRVVALAESSEERCGDPAIIVDRRQFDPRFPGGDGADQLKRQPGFPAPARSDQGHQAGTVMQPAQLLELGSTSHEPCPGRRDGTGTADRATLPTTRRRRSRRGR